MEKSESQSALSFESFLAREEFDSLERWLSSVEANHLDLRGLELGLEFKGRELLRLLMQAHVDARGDGDMGPSIGVINEKGQEITLTRKRMHARHIITIFGWVKVNRMGYRVKEEQSFHPLDQKLKLPMRIYSYEIQRRLVRHAVQGPFDEAVNSVKEQTGISIPKRSAEEIMIDAAVDFEAFYSTREVKAEGQEGAILVGSIDGKGIPMIKSELAEKVIRRKKGQKAQKKRMATVGTVFFHHPRVRTPEEVVESLFREKSVKANQLKKQKPQDKRVWASLKTPKEIFIKDVYEEMLRRNRKGKMFMMVVTDGEKALQRHVENNMENILLILDLLHVLEKLWTAGHAFYGEGSEQAEAYVRERVLRILQGEVSQVVKGMRQMVTKRKITGERKKTILGAAKYFYNNRTRMRYNVYLAMGLTIASGSVEGACKNLIKDRMERSGMRWSERMAEAMLKMRAVYLSGDLDEYWSFHVEQEQKRIYG